MGELLKRIKKEDLNLIFGSLDKEFLELIPEEFKESINKTQKFLKPRSSK